MPVMQLHASSALAVVGVNNELAASILPKTEVKVRYVSEQGLKKDQHGDHDGCPSEFVALDGG